MEDTVFCGVFDGHGPYGHEVARKVRDALPLKLIAECNLNLHPSFNLDDNDNDPSSTDGSHNHNAKVNFATLRESLLKAHKVLDRELKLYHHIDCYCSGTTAVTLIKQVTNPVSIILLLFFFFFLSFTHLFSIGILSLIIFFQGQELAIANVGDSRAVLGTRDQHGSLIAVQLTTDLKPSLPSIYIYIYLFPCMCMCICLKPCQVTILKNYYF